MVGLVKGNTFQIQTKIHEDIATRATNVKEIWPFPNFLTFAIKDLMSLAASLRVFVGPNIFILQKENLKSPRLQILLGGSSQSVSGQ